MTKNHHKPPAGEGSAAACCSPLEWSYSTAGDEIRGWLRGHPETTIYLIIVCEDRPDRGTMTGAFVPDADDANSHLERALIPFLKAAAVIYLREYYDHLRAALEAENA